MQGERSRVRGWLLVWVVGKYEASATANAERPDWEGAAVLALSEYQIIIILLLPLIFISQSLDQLATTVLSYVFIHHGPC